MAPSSNRDIDVARTYHEATKHSYQSVRVSGHFLDWSNRPLPYKIYPGSGTLALSRELSLSSESTLAVLNSRLGSSQSPLDLANLTRLLFCADGLTRRANVGGEDYHFRAAASAGALYPVEIYLVAGEIDGIEPGLYHFLPADLKLHGLRRGDWRPYVAACAGSDSVHRAGAILIMTTIFWRSAWKYRARAYRYCFWDTGTILANLLAAANADGLDSRVITSFKDEPIEKLLEVDGEREGIACLVSIEDSRADSAESPEPLSTGLESIPLSAKEVIYEKLVNLHRASRLFSSEEVEEVAGARFEPRQVQSQSTPITLNPEDNAAAMGLGETIVRRGSTRVFARQPISATELGAVLTANSPSIPNCPEVAETYLIVNAVEGIEPGAYYYQRERRTLELLKPGEFRAEAGYLCLEQPLGADCSALIIYMADLERTLTAFGNRGYRYAHLEAGLLGGRTYLAAYSLGRGATGLTFYDDDTSRFLQPHCGEMSPLLMVAVGVPHSRRTET